jgi:hypothetical protein
MPFFYQQQWCTKDFAALVLVSGCAFGGALNFAFR